MQRKNRRGLNPPFCTRYLSVCKPPTRPKKGQKRQKTPKNAHFWPFLGSFLDLKKEPIVDPQAISCPKTLLFRKMGDKMGDGFGDNLLYLMENNTKVARFCVILGHPQIPCFLQENAYHHKLRWHAFSCTFWGHFKSTSFRCKVLGHFTSILEVK